ncbi:MAG: VOC family protein [Pseudomonadota bacterium]
MATGLADLGLRVSFGRCLQLLRLCLPAAAACLSACATERPFAAPVQGDASDAAVRRTTIVVRDMERSLGFYRDLLGMSLLSRRDLSTDKTRNSLGLEQSARVEFAVLGSANQSTGLLGLLAIQPAVTERLARPAGREVAAGDLILIIPHADLPSLAATLQARGVALLTGLEKLEFTEGYELVVRDPDGVRVQLLQFGFRSGSTASR